MNQDDIAAWRHQKTQIDAGLFGLSTTKTLWSAQNASFRRLIALPFVGRCRKRKHRGRFNL